MENVGTGEEPDEKLEGEPSIADTLNIEEGIVSIGPVLVQGPGRGVVGGLDSQVVDDGDPHVRVGLQAEGQDGDADKEDRDNTNSLKGASCTDNDAVSYLPWQVQRSKDRQRCSRSSASSSSTSEGEPSIADTLNIEEGIVSIGPVLVQGPGRGVVGGLDSQVVDDGDPHVRVGLQAEGQDGDADKEDSCSTTGATYPTSQSSLVKVKVPCMCVWGMRVMRQV